MAAPRLFRVRRARLRRSGMTLVEVLITLGIVAVMATAVVLGFGMGDRGVSAQTEANRLSDRLGLAVDEVLVTRRPIALSWDADGYGFLTRGHDGRWTADDALLGPRHALPRGLTLSATAPALAPITADAGGSTVRWSLGDSKHRWTVIFDGLTAHSKPADEA